MNVIRLKPVSGWIYLTLLIWFIFLTACARPPVVTSQVDITVSTVQVRELAVGSVLITDKPKKSELDLGSVSVLPRIILVDTGESIQLNGAAYDVTGRLMETAKIVWSTVDPRAGSINKAGVFKAGIIPGKFNNAVSATAILNTADGTKTTSEYVSVTILGELQVPRLQSITVIPSNPTLLRQQIHRLRAVGFDENGLMIPDVHFVWELTEPSLGRLNEIGYLTVEGEVGTYEKAVIVTGIWQQTKITASTDIHIASTPKEHDFVQVHALPQQFHLDPTDRLQLRAVTLNGLGELISGTQLRWTMMDNKAGTIDGTGNFTASSLPGIYTEAVKVEAIVPGELGFVKAEDFASVVIRQQQTTNRLSHIFVDPGTITLPQQHHSTPLAKAINESGSAAENTTISWDIVKEEVGQITNEGVFTSGIIPGIFPESVQVTASQTLGEETVIRTELVDVIITGALTKALVHPSLAIIDPGRTVHFSLTGYDSNLIELSDLVILWSVSDDDIGTIDHFGNFTAGQTSGMYQEVIQAEVVQTLPNPP